MKQIFRLWQRWLIMAIGCTAFCIMSKGEAMHEDSPKGFWGYVHAGYDKVSQTASHAYESAREWVSPDVSFVDEMKKVRPFMGKTIAEIRDWRTKALQHLIDIRVTNQINELTACAHRLNTIIASEYGQEPPADAARQLIHLDEACARLQAIMREINDARNALHKATK